MSRTYDPDQLARARAARKTPLGRLEKIAADLAAHLDAVTTEPVLTTHEVARMLRVSTEWLETCRARGIGPRWFKTETARVRYHKRDVIDYLVNLAQQGEREAV